MTQLQLGKLCCLMPVQAPTSALSVRNHSDIIRVAIERQFARCTTAIPGGPFDADFHAWILENVERMNDADLMVVALYRLLRLAEWTSNASFATEELRAEVGRFRKAVPHLREIRDTQEHFDAYGSGTGHREILGLDVFTSETAPAGAFNAAWWPAD